MLVLIYQHLRLHLPARYTENLMRPPNLDVRKDHWVSMHFHLENEYRTLFVSDFHSLQ
jgi:hypothetical protein